MRWMRAVGPVVFAALSCSCFVAAQSASGNLQGTVTDSTGAVMPGATVRILAASTAQERVEHANDSGTFVFQALPVGDYRLQVEMPGFARWEEPGLHMNVGDQLQLAVHMRPATATDTVEVHGADVSLQTNGIAQGEVVSEREVLDLPLNGRNFSQLGLLQAGVRPMTSGLIEQGGSRRSGHAYEVNGQRPESNNYLVDGMRVLNRADGGFALRLPIDAIAEFRILTATAPAEFGGTSGGITTIVTRSGTNRFHGNVYEFFRNDTLDAKNYFSLHKEALHQNQFGGTIGGPIRQDKLFFFVYYEGFRNIQGITHGVTVPTVAERNGDFSGDAPIVVNGTRAPFGQQITQANINPIAQRYLAFFPVPNTGVHTATTTQIGRFANDQGGAKADWIAGGKDVLSARYAYATQFNSNPFSVLGSDIPGFPVGDYLNTHLGGLTETHTFNPRTVLTANASIFQHHYVLEKRFSGYSPEAFGFQYATTLAQANGAPAVLVDGYSNLGDPIIGPRDTVQNDYQYTGAVSYSRGSHVSSVGVLFRRTQFNGYQGNYANGAFTFNSQGFTNNSLANFLLGLPNQYTQDGGSFSRNLRGWEFSAYAQDEWRASPQLTLNYGLRYEITTPFRETQNRLNAFVPGQQSVVHPDAPTGILFPGDPGVPDTIAPIFKKGFAPRVGFAYNVDGNGRTMLRGAFGLFYDFLLNGVGGPLRVATQTLPTTVIRNLTGAINFANPLATTPDALTPGTYALPAAVFTLDSHILPPYAQDWNVTVEQQVRGQVLSVGYLGSKGTHLPRFVEGNPAVYQPGATAANANRRRIYSGCGLTTGVCKLGAVALVTGNTDSNYNSGVVSLTRRGSHALNYTLAYTYSKNLDDVSSLHLAGPAPLLITGETDVAQNPFDLKAEYGPSLFDARHRFVGSVTYAIPVASGLKGVAHTLLADWQVNGIFTVNSATPFTVYDSRNVSLQAPHPSISGVFADRPDVATNPNHGSHTIAQWVSRGAFQRLDAVTQAGQFGNERRNSVRGPGYGNLDASLLKTFQPTERSQVQFRAEAFNVTNHTNLFLPVDDLNSPAFGQITEAQSPRVLQFALKLQR